MKFLDRLCEHYGAYLVQILFAGVLCVVALVGLMCCSDCGGPAFEENLFGAVQEDSGATQSDSATPLDASATPEGAGIDVGVGQDASVDSRSTYDACDCYCIATTIGSDYCEGGVFANCHDTEAGPVVTCR